MVAIENNTRVEQRDLRDGLPEEGAQSEGFGGGCGGVGDCVNSTGNNRSEPPDDDRSIPEIIGDAIREKAEEVKEKIEEIKEIISPKPKP